MHSLFCNKFDFWEIIIIRVYITHPNEDKWKEPLWKYLLFIFWTFLGFWTVGGSIVVRSAVFYSFCELSSECHCMPNRSQRIQMCSLFCKENGRNLCSAEAMEIWEVIDWQSGSLFLCLRNITERCGQCFSSIYNIWVSSFYGLGQTWALQFWKVIGQ